jgi:hypothetical protein
MAKLPEMTREEEAEFWKTHSFVDYLDDMEPVEVELDPSIKGPRDVSPRCSVCDDVLLSRYVDLEVAGGRATLHGLRQLYCRQGHIVKLAREAEETVRKVETALQEEQPEREAA